MTISDLAINSIVVIVIVLLHSYYTCRICRTQPVCAVINIAVFVSMRGEAHDAFIRKPVAEVLGTACEQTCVALPESS